MVGTTEADAVLDGHRKAKTKDLADEWRSGDDDSLYSHVAWPGNKLMAGAQRCRSLRL